MQIIGSGLMWKGLEVKSLCGQFSWEQMIKFRVKYLGLHQNLIHFRYECCRAVN